MFSVFAGRKIKLTMVNINDVAVSDNSQSKEARLVALFISHSDSHWSCSKENLFFYWVTVFYYLIYCCCCFDLEQYLTFDEVHV